MTIDEVRQKTGPILERHGIAYAGVFGSVARAKTAPKATWTSWCGWDALSAWWNTCA